MQSCRQPTIRQQPIASGPRNFQVILSDMIRPDDRASLLALLAEFRTAAHVKQQALAKGLTVEVLDNRGRVLVVKWHGIEVAVLFQRQIGQVTIAPVETSPAVIIKSPEEAWVSFNLLGVRYDQEINALKDRVLISEATSSHTNKLLHQFQVQTEQQVHVIYTLQKQITQLEEELTPFKTAVRSKELPDGSKILIQTKYKKEIQQVVREVQAKPGKYSQTVKEELYRVGNLIKTAKGKQKKELQAAQAVLQSIVDKTVVKIKAAKKKPVKKSKATAKKKPVKKKGGKRRP